MKAFTNLNRLWHTLRYFIGPLLFLVIVSIDLELPQTGQLFLGVFGVVVSLWLLTPVPLFISGIFGVVLSILLGISSSKEAFSSFSSPVIFLFLGGFLIARSLEKTGLDKLLAQKILSHPWTAVSAKRTILVFLSLSFVLSMWMSNTATVAMLLPISYGILNRLEMNFGLSGPRFSERVLLGLAFSATVGGNMTPIGSPPNVIAIGLLKSIGGVQISFLEWMLVATPFSLILFYFIYRFCIKTIPDSRISLSEAVDIKDYTSFSKEQKYVLIIFCLAVFLWIFPSMIKLLLPEENTLALAITQHLSAPVVSIFLACFLFLVPIFEGKKVLGTHDVSHIDWSSLLLFGSGLSLGQILFKTGGAEFLMSLIKGLSGSLSVGIIIALLILFTIFFTEIASNTATANIILPVVIALGLELELSPTLLALSFAFACNSAFMMPVATPPNAIVFGSQRVEKMAMIRSGLLFNLIGAGLLIMVNFILVQL